MGLPPAASSTNATQFSLSKIHRFIRPLRTSILSFNQSLLHLNRPTNADCHLRLQHHIQNRRKRPCLLNRYQSQARRKRVRRNSDDDRRSSSQNEGEMEFIPLRSTSRSSKLGTTARTSHQGAYHKNRTRRRSARLGHNDRTRSQITSPIFMAPQTLAPIISSNDRFDHLFNQNPSSRHRPNNLGYSSTSSVYQKEVEIELKIDKLILSYKNILDGVLTPSDQRLRHHLHYRSIVTSPVKDHQSPPQNPQLNTDLFSQFRTVDRLTLICARLLGRSIESSIHSCAAEQAGVNKSESEAENEALPRLSLSTENDYKTSLMDEWYDSIPILYRRYAVAQHALTLILMNSPKINHFSAISTCSPTKATHLTIRSYQKLFQGIHQLHQSYTHSPLILPQVSMILPYLFDLVHPTEWYQIYRDYDHCFGLAEYWIGLFKSRLKLRDCAGKDGFLTVWCDWRLGLVDLVDQMVERLSLLGFQSWLESRERLIGKRTEWRCKSNESNGGLESSSSEDEGLSEKMIIEFDQRTSPVILKWINSLILSCGPNSIHSRLSRRQLNSISRICFESLMDSKQNLECNRSDQAFLLMVSITLESHRLALTGLRMFNASIFPRIEPISWKGEADEHQDQQDGFQTAHQPMRLQLILPKFPLTHLESKILSRSAKVFLRTHQATRLLMVAPRPSFFEIEQGGGEIDGGWNSQTGRNEKNLKVIKQGMNLQDEKDRVRIPGLDKLLRLVIESEYRLESLAKCWIESLLLTDPSSWTRNERLESKVVDSHREEEDENRSECVRKWLENWLEIITRVENSRLRESQSDQEQEGLEEEETSFTLTEDCKGKGKAKATLNMDEVDESRNFISCTCHLFGSRRGHDGDDCKPSIKDSDVTTAAPGDHVIHDNRPGQETRGGSICGNQQQRSDQVLVQKTGSRAITSSPQRRPEGPHDDKPVGISPVNTFSKKGEAKKPASRDKPRKMRRSKIVMRKKKPRQGKAQGDAGEEEISGMNIETDISLEKRYITPVKTTRHENGSRLRNKRISNVGNLLEVQRAVKTATPCSASDGKDISRQAPGGDSGDSDSDEIDFLSCRNTPF